VEKDTTNARSLHALREEFRKAREGKRAVLVNVEDAIFTRIIEAEELLIVATGLFIELSETKDNWLWRHEAKIVGARWALHDVIHDRSFPVVS